LLPEELPDLEAEGLLFLLPLDGWGDELLTNEHVAGSCPSCELVATRHVEDNRVSTECCGDINHSSQGNQQHEGSRGKVEEPPSVK
jgi:hypothetical protein